MKIKFLLFLLCLVSLNVMGQGTITRKKKQTTETVAPKPKPTPKPAPKPTPTPKPTPEAAGYDVTFTCNVSSASLYIDGNAYGNASGTRFLKTGSHNIWVTANGYEDYYRSITVNHQNASCSISMTRKPEPVRNVVATSGILNNHEWVDLGLSVKWATCNVGASSPSDYGDYYAWGETSTKSRYDWDNCFDCLDSTGDSWGIYNVGGQTSIAPTSGHDTARENWGGTWRMPTDAETVELGNKCRWTWTSKNGHNGYIVTGPNGNSIFLPAAGFRVVTDSSVGTNGNYWVSTLGSSGSQCAARLYFGNGYHYPEDDFFRCVGQSVRPVTE